MQRNICIYQDFTRIKQRKYMVTLSDSLKENSALFGFVLYNEPGGRTIFKSEVFSSRTLFSQGSLLFQLLILKDVGGISFFRLKLDREKLDSRCSRTSFSKQAHGLLFDLFGWRKSTKLAFCLRGAPDNSRIFWSEWITPMVTNVFQVSNISRSYSAYVSALI